MNALILLANITTRARLPINSILTDIHNYNEIHEEISTLLDHFYEIERTIDRRRQEIDNNYLESDQTIQRMYQTVYRDLEHQG